jgi:hypothetical protein
VQPASGHRLDTFEEEMRGTQQAMSSQRKATVVRPSVLPLAVLAVACAFTFVFDQATQGEASMQALPVDLGALRGNTADISYTEHTVAIDAETARKTLRSASKNGSVLVFAPSPEISKLQAGAVLLIRGLAILRVLAVTPVQGNIAVLTAPAAVGDAVREARIHTEYSPAFSKAASGPPSGVLEAAPRGYLAGVLSILQRQFTEVVHAQNTLTEVNGTVKGWDVKLKATQDTDRVNLQLNVKKVEAGIHAQLSGDGYLHNFDTSSDIEIHDSMLRDFRWSNKNLNGVMNLQWEIAKDKPGVWAEEDQIPLQDSPAEFPFVIGGLPMTLSVTAALLVHPGMNEANQLSEGHFRIEYDGYQRFGMHSGNIEEDGSIHGDIKILDTRALSPAAGHAIIVALAAPRIELKVGVSSAWKNLTRFVPGDLAELAVQAFLSNTYVQQAMRDPQLATLLQRALGTVKEAVEMTLKSDAAAHLDFITTASILDSGPMVIVPCQRAQAIITVKVGANAQVFAQSLGTVDKEIFRHGINVGPKTGPCAASSEGY